VRVIIGASPVRTSRNGPLTDNAGSSLSWTALTPAPATPHVTARAGSDSPAGEYVTAVKRPVVVPMAFRTPGDGQSPGLSKRPGVVASNVPWPSIQPNVPPCRRPIS
jgi:hypothetical protein